MKFETTEDDLEFRDQMESGQFPVCDFNHRTHLRLAYIYLSDNDTSKSTEVIRDTLNRFLLPNGVDPSKYHATLTKAWILAVHHFMNKSGGCKSADIFISSNPEMLDFYLSLSSGDKNDFYH